jgi:hypothetical protein
LTEVCVINGEDTNCHKLQYFPNSPRGKVADLFGRYEIAHPTLTWAKVQRAFITRFNEIRSERQATIASWYAKQKKYESMEDYYDQFLRLCVVIPQQPNNIYLKEGFKKGLWYQLGPTSCILKACNMALKIGMLNMMISAVLSMNDIHGDWL